MNAKRDELAEKYYQSVPWQYVNNQSFKSVSDNAFKAGWSARDTEVAKLQSRIAKLEAALREIRNKTILWQKGGHKDLLAHINRTANEALESEKV